ncbi:BPSL1445 family SYLF domain-containing lipoprotein [Paraburkholderia hayleyella]|uniref:BPSL1445 family SYLF domain-containing lipoprotein n=1 Tax=Paraburkholderia hayleyella TaxID=2152889 RepID=UPI00129234DD|nr:YSC84-related protein [Paraburkholderia hayleyella]
MQRRKFILTTTALAAGGLVAVTGCTVTPHNSDTAAANPSKRQAIDASVDGTLTRLYSTIKGSRELVAKARGVLVFPSVVQAGIVIGGQYGEGSLRVGGSTVGYYSTTSGSVGAQLGMQSKAIIYLFMTQAALDSFRNSDGWSVGGDASVALVKTGANGAIDTATGSSSRPVEAIVLTNSGLMGDLSLASTKVSRLKI